MPSEQLTYPRPDEPADPRLDVSHAAYMRDYRAARPAYVARQRKLTRARDRARRSLVELHPGEFDVLFRQECKIQGVDPDVS